MQLHCEFTTPVARTDLDDYVRHLRISIGCYDEECREEHIVGRLAMDQILWADACVDGVSLFEICDNDSQGLHEVHSILTKGKQEIRSDLRINEVTDHVMFLYGAVFHPSIHACRQGILDAAFTLFGQESLARRWAAGVTDFSLCAFGPFDIFREAILAVPLANFLDGIFVWDLGNFLEGIFFLMVEDFFDGSFAMSCLLGLSFP